MNESRDASCNGTSPARLVGWRFTPKEGGAPGTPLGAGGKAGARCWLWCKGFVQCLEPDGRGVGACRAMACDRLSAAGQLFPGPSHVPAFVGKEGRKLSKECVSAPCTRHPRCLSSRMLLHFVPPVHLPYKAKMSQCSSARVSSWQGQFGQPGTQAERGCRRPALTWLS